MQIFSSYLFGKKIKLMHILYNVTKNVLVYSFNEIGNLRDEKQ